ncbi:uncharacterized protein LOC130440644 [Diorhabda sublineata]|uniref:uncharacterized protein LOC130440644 n=1 Tax=Diorhabda sublineata TaxID=1163346 RepID=UPI0024E11719|nr:uncharacterized protein LOC130440644 [Diorhabda sublineata]
MIRDTTETRHVTAKTKRLLEISEMKVLRKITGKTLLDRERIDDIRQKCRVENINDWILSRKCEWNEHISRMSEERIVRIARENSLLGRRSMGRPRKRWNDKLTINLCNRHGAKNEQAICLKWSRKEEEVDLPEYFYIIGK